MFSLKFRKELEEEGANEAVKLEIIDVYLTAFLKLKGIKPVPIKKSSKIAFLVDDSETVKKLIVEFNNNADVKVLDFVTCVKEIKAIIFAHKSGGAL